MMQQWCQGCTAGRQQVQSVQGGWTKSGTKGGGTRLSDGLDLFFGIFLRATGHHPGTRTKI